MSETPARGPHQPIGGRNSLFIAVSQFSRLLSKMNPESSEQSSFASSSQTPIDNETPRSQGIVYSSVDGLPEEALRLLSAQRPEPSALSNTPWSYIASDTTTLDRGSTYRLPTESREYKYEPSLTNSGDTLSSGDSSTLATQSPGPSPTKIDEKLARRPRSNPEFEDYTYNADARINISERHRRDGGILPSPGTRSHLHCPFKSLDGCGVMFDVREKKLWKLHSLDHFQGIKPPENLACTFEDLSGQCRERFVAEGGKIMHNWNEKMEHLAKHYEDILDRLRSVFVDADPVLDANALSEVTHTPNEDFEKYIRRERRRLEDLVMPNRLPPSYGGVRFREVVFGRPSPYPERHLHSGNATQYTIASERRANQHERIILR